MLTKTALAAYRAGAYALEHAVTSQEAAIDYVNRRGFVLFWPLKGIVAPSLWTAVAGDRPVADEHDDPGHVTWGWKDELLGKRRWYYAKVLRKKATLIALDVAPYFYALSENFGSPEEDYLDQYRQGTLTQEAKTIYETLLREGLMNTVALRKATFMAGKQRSYPFERALAALQADFKILPVGVAQAGAWRYAFTYDCVHRHYPELPESARHIGAAEAQRMLVGLYFKSVGAAALRDVQKLFQWPKRECERAIAALVEAGALAADIRIEGERDAGFALRQLVEA